LTSCSTSYSETALPASAFAGVTFFPFWDDLYMYTNTSQGIYYAIEGTTPNSEVIFEYYTGHFSDPTSIYQFQVKFFENQPGVIQYMYYAVHDDGASATVGVQSKTSIRSIVRKRKLL
jgi:hypothetical protein